MYGILPGAGIYCPVEQSKTKTSATFENCIFYASRDILQGVMSTTNEKIGDFIAQIRQERGLTQAEFASRLGTSQSAINRIEKGRQNLSLETIGRLSDVLNKQIIAIPGSSVNLRIEGGHELHGKMPLKTSKNAAVALLCASLLNYGVTRFKNFPRIEEVNRIIEVLESIGVRTKWLPGNDLEIRRPEKLQLENMNKEAARRTRSVLMLIGSIMHDHESFKIPYAGGCKLGERTVEPHLFALQEFGVDIVATQGHYNVTANKKSPGEVTLYEQGNTVTNNVMMAAARTHGTTYVQSASGDYMTQDLAYFLQKLGVKIEGIGTPFLKITGVNGPHQEERYLCAHRRPHRSNVLHNRGSGHEQRNHRRARTVSLDCTRTTEAQKDGPTTHHEQII